jgi:hypothetical protein
LTAPDPYTIPGVPAQGPLLNYDHIETWYDSLITLVATVTPALVAMIELWIRLFSFVLAPISILYLIHFELWRKSHQKEQLSRNERNFLSAVCLIGNICSVILLTDSLYIFEYGPTFGGTLVGLTFVLSWNICSKHSLHTTCYGIISILFVLAVLIYDHKAGTITFGNPNDVPSSIDEGLYYDSKFEDWCSASML